MRKYLILLVFLSIAGYSFGQNGIIKGTVYNGINKEPIGFANVAITGTTTGTSTDDLGAFELSGLKPDLYSITVSFLGFETKIIDELQVSNSKPLILEISMAEVITEFDVIDIKASPFVKKKESPLSLRTIGIAEIKRNPGGGRDISQVVQSLPGVTSTANFRNDLIIRGGSPNENRFYLDDIEVPNINHFATQGATGGPVGMINVDFVREVEFYSGAFPANKGNALSSIFNFRFTDGRDDRLGFSATVGASDLGLTLEGPIGKKTTFIASARRSYLQFLFELIGLPFLPTYNDFQAKVKHKIDNKNEIYFIGLGAVDDFKLNEEANETEFQQYILGNITVNKQWNYTNGIVYKHYQDEGYWTFVGSRNMLNNTAEKYLDNDDTDPNNLVLDYASQEIENKLRAEHTRQINKWKLNAGVAYEYVKYNNSTVNKVFDGQGAREINYASDINFSKYALFGQGSLNTLKDKLDLSFGLRLDGNSYSGEMSNLFKQLSPRFSASYQFSPQTSLNFNTGIYYQLPPYTVLGYRDMGTLVNEDNSKYVRNTHLVFGVEHNPRPATRITLEFYLKNYSNYPFLLNDSLTLANIGGDFGVIGAEPTVSSKKGRSYGAELLIQQKLFKGFYGIAALTYGDSQFEDKNGDLTPSSWDSRFILNLTAGKRFNKNWEVGLSYRFQSGLPYTPSNLLESSLISSWDRNGQERLDYDLLNSERRQAFQGLDMRVDKKWFFKKYSLNLYLDITNLYGIQPEESFLVLDRPLDMDGNPVGGPVVDPNDSSRYLLKSIDSDPSSPIPTIGVVFEW